jgi:hypothetical protein
MHSPLDSITDDFCLLRHHEITPRLAAFQRAYKANRSLTLKAFLERDFAPTLAALHSLIMLTGDQLQLESTQPTTVISNFNEYMP